MKKVKKIEEPDKIDASNLPPIKIPEEKRQITAEVNSDLFKKAHGIMKKRGLKIRDMIEYGLVAFIERHQEDLLQKKGA